MKAKSVELLRYFTWLDKLVSFGGKLLHVHTPKWMDGTERGTLFTMNCQLVLCGSSNTEKSSGYTNPAPVIIDFRAENIADVELCDQCARILEEWRALMEE